MCGIYGIVSYSLPREEILRRLSHMGRLQRHRGPDDQRETVISVRDRWVGLGFVRLSILDLETGMQPIQCPEDQSVIICNGQIYNYIELRSEVSGEPFVSKGDVEVALHLYRRIGLDFLQRLNGMYAGAILDPIREKLLMFRDRFGIKPLYYATWDGNFVFSSEIRPLLAGSGLPRRLNHSKMGTLFTYRYLPGEETMFYGLKRLPPGSYLEYDLKSGKYHVERYWEYHLDRENPDLSLDEAAGKFNTLFTDAVRIRLRSDVEVGSLLSGGIDSSAVASRVARLRPDVRVFTLAFDEEKYNELPSVERLLKANPDHFASVRLMTRVCGRESLDQLPEIVRAIEEPISLGAVLPTDQVCQLAGMHVKVVLTGEGADEIFAGYRKFLLEMAAHEYGNLSGEGQRELEEIYPELHSYMAVRDRDPVRRYIQSELLFGRDELRRLIGREPPADLFPEDALPALSGKEHPLNAALAMESRFRLPDYVILRLDKLSMRHSLETRTPFLDYRLAEFAATLPPGFKVHLGLGQEKMICRYAFVKHSVLDRETAYREKQPFTVPLADWLSDPSSLPDFMKEILLGDVVERQGVLSGSMVKELARMVSAEGVGPETLVSGADRVFAVIVFTLWYEEFFG
ncbi:MAG: asparagine synthase (glutamine-hydrolyzing) [Desulfatiglandaceae bacterium]